ncbi:MULTISPECIES: hypothetical protein [Pseudomonas]|uniref:Uncharacterized protein n=1 Tax=Pseudomonas glycinae TaxID=1785145 RepID=A0ABN4MMP1_9PSED|nr:MULTISPECIES: hypothetical protein [Pseudomonas]AMQ83515.1 hypothetical protein AWU82_09390 [Pseudomonas glycinae]NKF29523.1 hypothetical protein [Pseudomonas sp. BG5]
MIAEDFEIIKEVFEIVEAGIVQGYDAFHYHVEVGKSHMETELCVEKNGLESWSAEADFDDSKVYFLVERLRANAIKRGELWKSFVLSYREGEQVRTKFNY